MNYSLKHFLIVRSPFFQFGREPDHKYVEGPVVPKNQDPMVWFFTFFIFNHILVGTIMLSCHNNVVMTSQFPS